MSEPFPVETLKPWVVEGEVYGELDEIVGLTNAWLEPDGKGEIIRGIDGLLRPALREIIPKPEDGQGKPQVERVRITVEVTWAVQP